MHKSTRLFPQIPHGTLSGGEPHYIPQTGRRVGKTPATPKHKLTHKLLLVFFFVFSFSDEAPGSPSRSRRRRRLCDCSSGKRIVDGNSADGFACVQSAIILVSYCTARYQKKVSPIQSGSGRTRRWRCALGRKESTGEEIASNSTVFQWCVH